MPVLDDPVVVLPKIGGNYYRVTAWAKDRPGLPTNPDASKAIWRRHNIVEDVIETTEPIPGIAALDIAKEGIPENGIGNWTVADFKGVERDEEAYKPFKLNAHRVSNHCVGVLTYDEFQALKYYTKKHETDPSLLKLQAAADLKAIAQIMPWGEAFSRGAPVVGLDGALLTPAKIAERWQAIIPAPVPKCLDRCIEAAYEVVVEDRQPPLKPVEEIVDLYAESRGQKVPGWTPTNCYIGTVKDSQTTVSTAINWQDNTQKHAMVFTTGSAYTIASNALNLRIAGAPTGELVLRIYADDPTGGQVTLATGTINIAELTTSALWIWFSLATAALGNATVYTLELTTTATLDGTNYIILGSNAAGGAAGNQRWLYSGGSWAAQGASRLGFVTADNADGGKFIVRADDTIASFATIKGAAVHTSDTYTVTMGATLTRATNVTCLQGRQGDTVTGSTPAYAAQVATYRYGCEVVSAGVTVAWTGAALGLNSGYIQNPITADSSSRECRVAPNGTAANPVILTNSVGAYNANNRWTWNSTYGGITSGCNYVSWLNMGPGNSTIWTMGASSSNTTQTSFTYDHWTIDHNTQGSGTWCLFVSNSDLAVTFNALTVNSSYGGGFVFGQQSATLAAGFSVRWPEAAWVATASGAYWLTSITSGRTLYFSRDGIYVTDSRFSEATPTTFAVADRGTGGELTVTVANISAIAANDYLKIYLADGTLVATYSRARYEAAYGTKEANCAIVTGLANGTAYNGMYAKYTRDSILFGAASNTANGTPTLSAAYADYVTLENSRNTDPGAAYVLREADGGPASYLIRGSTKTPAYDFTAAEAARNTDPGAANVLREADGGPASYLIRGSTKTPAFNESARNTDPGEAYVLREADGGPASYKIKNATKTPAYNFTAAEAARNDDDGITGADVIAGHAPKIKDTTYTGTATGGSPLVSLSIILDAVAIAINGTGTVTGGVTANQNITGATVTLTRKKKSDGSTVASLINTTVNLVQNVQKTWAAILGADCTFSPTVAREEYLEATVSGGSPAITSETVGQSGYVVKPAAPTWATVATTPGDGTMVLSVVAGAATDEIYARQRRFLSSGAWSAESETFKRTGTGNITITGLTNEQYREYVVYAKAGGVTSDWTEPRYDVPTDGATAVIDRLMDAVVAEIGTMGLTSETTAGASVNVTAEVEVPPDFETVDTPIVKVFPDTEEAAADHNDLNEIRYRVNVAFCQRSKTAGQVADQYRIREKLRDQFLGKRLVGMLDHYCDRETESGVLDLDALWERFHWVSVLTLEFVALRAQG